jgi:hypothetical protein
MCLAQFRVRSLLVLVVFAGLLLAVSVLSVQNKRLRQENAKLQVNRTALLYYTLIDSQPLDWPADPVTTLFVADPESIPQMKWVLEPSMDDMMPNGPDAFGKNEIAK